MLNGSRNHEQSSWTDVICESPKLTAFWAKEAAPFFKTGVILMYLLYDQACLGIVYDRKTSLPLLHLMNIPPVNQMRHVVHVVLKDHQII